VRALPKELEPMMEPADFTRRTMLVLGAAAASFAVRAQSAPPALRRLVFEVWRGKRVIGRHSLTFSGGDKDFAVSIVADMAVNLGPVAIFRYRHRATETWRGGRFAELNSQTSTNGKQEQVTAVRVPEGVVVRTLASQRTLSPAALPLTHWNEHALVGPLFNPQTGSPMRESVTRQPGQVLPLANARSVVATRYALLGDANIVDWYDADGVWTALRGKVGDGSYIDYRRAV
jgi:hypothetical protein